MNAIMWITVLLIFFVVPIIFGMNSTNSAFRETETCTTNVKIDHGFVEVDILTNNFRGQILKVYCNIGYDLKGSSKLFCINGHWEFKYEPQCLKRCPAPNFVPNSVMDIIGHRDIHNTYSVNTVVTYKCTNSFVSHPYDYNGTQVCKNGRWNGTIGTCRPQNTIMCNMPPVIRNGFWEKQDSDLELFSVGQSVKYVCKKGYSLHGHMLKRCNENGTWIPNENFQCNPENSKSSFIFLFNNF